MKVILSVPDEGYFRITH